MHCYAYNLSGKRPNWIVYEAAVLEYIIVQCNENYVSLSYSQHLCIIRKQLQPTAIHRERRKFTFCTILMPAWPREDSGTCSLKSNMSKLNLLVSLYERCQDSTAEMGMLQISCLQTGPSCYVDIEAVSTGCHLVVWKLVLLWWLDQRMCTTRCGCWGYTRRGRAMKPQEDL